MSYASREDLRSRLGNAAYQELYGAAPAAADEDLAGAAAEIDGALAARYAVPVVSDAAAPLLKDWTLTLAEERASARAAGANFAEKVKDRAAQVRKYLDMILAEEFHLSGAAVNETDGVAAHVVVSADGPNFTRESLEGY